MPADLIKRIVTPHYAFAALAVAIAVGLRLAFDPILDTYSPYLPFVAAVLTAERLGGRGPAFAATGLSCISVWYLFLAPRFSFALPDPRALVGLLLFAVLAGAISVLPSAARPLAAGVAAGRMEHADGLDGTLLLWRTGVLAGAVLSLGILASLLWAGFQRTADAENQVQHTYQVLNAAVSLRSSLAEVESAQRGYLLTLDDRFFGAYQSALGSELQSRRTLRVLTAGSRAQQARLDEFDRVVKDRLDVLATSIEALRKHKDAIAGMRGHHRCEELVDRLHAILDDVEAHERVLLQGRTAAVSAEDLYTRWVLGLGTGSLVLLVVLAAAVIERHAYERKSAQKLLAHQARLIDLSHDAIIMADRNRIITGWNFGAQQMYGWSEREALGKAIHELLHTNSGTPIAEIDRILARQECWDGELIHRRVDGREIMAESRHVQLRDDVGLPAGYLEINRDITARKQGEAAVRRLNAELENRVRERTAQLEAANKELEAFAYSVSHDLRAPLRGIDGWSLALLEDYEDRLDAEGKRYLGRVRSEAQRMSLLIDDMLELSRIARADMRRDAVDLSAIAATVAARLREIHGERRIQFDIESDLTTNGDARLLEILISNLLENAVKFTGTRAEAYIQVGRDGRNGESVFFVRDNGVGFDMAFAGQLFGAFQRLHSVSEFPGTGIGLATVQRIVNRHGGRVWAEAATNEGATFSFTIPGGPDDMA